MLAGFTLRAGKRLEDDRAVFLQKDKAIKSKGTCDVLCLKKEALVLLLLLLALAVVALDCRLDILTDETYEHILSFIF